MAIEPVKIPQNVYVEDRIIGPVTLKQLAIVGIGTGISYALFSTASRAGPISIPYGVILWTPAMIAAAFAFLRINDLSLFNIILLMIEHANKPNQRYWSSHPGISINFVSKAAKQAVIDANTKISENAAKLAELTRQMEKREEELVKLASHAVAPVDSAPSAIPVPSGGRRLDGISAMHSAPVTAQPSTATASSGTPGLQPQNSIDGIRAAAAPTADAQAATPIDGIQPAPKSEAKKEAPQHPLDAFKHVFPEQ